MPTAHSSTDPGTVTSGRWDDLRRAVSDVRALIGFRAAAVRGRARFAAGTALAVIALVTLAAAWVPAHLPGAAGSGAPEDQFRSQDALLLLPSAYLGVLFISVISAASSGGGRELLAREQSVAFPVSPTTDHLGALLMAPLNIAWLLQSWVVLAATAFVVGPDNLLAAQLPVVLWLAVATALAQCVAWLVEWVRRGERGAWVIRSVAAVLLVGFSLLVATDQLVNLLDQSPTLEITLAALYGSEGRWWPWLVRVAVLAVMALLAVAAGAVAAHALSGRAAHDEMRAETSQHARRPNPSADLVAMVRVDRAGIWRSVPLRRGFAVLAFLPGLVAVVTGMEWYMLNILPGLVASGGALLFGVNAWMLDGRGALWRESLPVHPGLVFVSRLIVLLEVLLVAIALALALAMMRAGIPTTEQLVAVLCSTVVVTLQVVAGAMRWSIRRPFAVDLRSPRATPAPPLTMVGYSTRLALVTTFTGMLFVGTSRLPAWQLSVLVAVPFLLVSMFRILRSVDLWTRPDLRSRVVTSVAS